MSKRLSQKITYSILSAAADIYLRPIEEMPHLKFEVFIHQESKGIFQAKLGGKFNLYNICASIAASIKYNVDWESTIKSIVNFESNNNRSQWIEFGNKKVFLDAYNANPSSVAVGLESFSTIKGSKAVILGDMLELGHHSQKEHLDIFELAVKLNFEEFFICGPEFSLANNFYPFKFDSAATLLAWLDTHPIESEYIYVKGSRGMKMETVLEHFKA
jgi:UDP-N-acetylmuramoyl-tripeptide--D-alanyl-D-alanine ligase